MTLVQVDGGAPAARYSGSAAGAGGQRDWGRALWTGFFWQDGALRACLPTHHPAALVIVQAGLHNSKIVQYISVRASCPQAPDNAQAAAIAEADLLLQLFRRL